MLILNFFAHQIGAVNGSEEFRLGVSINFDMQGRTSGFVKNVKKNVKGRNLTSNTGSACATIRARGS